MHGRRGPIDDDARAGGPAAGKLPPALLGAFPAGRLSPQQVMEEQRRGRILLAALDVFGQKGFASATVQDLIDRAGISRATFYKYFEDRERCLAALSDELLSWLEAEAREAATGADRWASQLVLVTERLVDLVGGDERIARICGPETSLVGAGIDARRATALTTLVDSLRAGRQQSKGGAKLPVLMEEFLVLGSVDLVARSALDADGPSPKELSSDLAELILMHYLGSTRARKTIRGL
jgi:AcrR family transcriptional regulator